MVTYEDTLLAMEHLLDRIEERSWRDSIREDVRLWRESRDTSHHLAQYAGMSALLAAGDGVVCVDSDATCPART